MGKRLHRFHQNQKRYSCCKERKAQPYTLEPPQRKHVKRERKENQRKQFLFLRKCARIGSPSTSLSTRSNPHTKPRPMGGAFSCSFSTLFSAFPPATNHAPAHPPRISSCKFTSPTFRLQTLMPKRSYAFSLKRNAYFSSKTFAKKTFGTFVAE